MSSEIMCVLFILHTTLKAANAAWGSSAILGIPDTCLGHHEYISRMMHTSLTWGSSAMFLGDPRYVFGASQIHIWSAEYMHHIVTHISYHNSQTGIGYSK
jgi:hypothetical protein